MTAENPAEFCRAQSVLVVGVGSPFGDDALAWDLVDALQARDFRALGQSTRYLRGDRPGPGLLDMLKGGRRVFLVDAMQAGLSPGKVRLLNREELLDNARPISSHALGVAEVLKLGEALGALPEELWLLGIQAGSDVTDEMVMAAERAMSRVRERNSEGVDTC